MHRILTLALAALLLSSLAVNAAFTTEQPMDDTTFNTWEPSVAAHPTQPIVYMTARWFTTPQQLRIKKSVDGGVTWMLANHPSIANQGWQADGILKVAANGNLYAAWLTQSGNANNWFLYTSVSTDGATTWSTPVRPDVNDGAAWADKPWMTVSADGLTVHVAYYAGTKSNGGATCAFIVTSRDGAKTFSTPVRIDANDGMYWYALSAAVDPINAGTAYFSWSRETTAGTTGADLWLSKTTNHGVTWTSQRIVNYTPQGPSCTNTLEKCNADEFNALMVVQIDPAGKLMLAYTNGTAPGANKVLFTITSTDGGASWSQPVSVTLSRAGDQGFQALASGGINDFRIIWSDNRNGPNSYNVYYSQTLDGGLTWSGETLLSNVGTYSGASYKTSSGFNFPGGDYFGLDVIAPNNVSIAIWGEAAGRETSGSCWYAIGN